MNWRLLLLCAALLMSLSHFWHQWQLRPMHPPAGQIAPLDPIQRDLADAAPVPYGRWTLLPRARYDISARILRREDYGFDAMAELAPEDLALGWGPMSDSDVLRSFKIDQSARFYSWQPLGPLPIPRDIVISHSANTHVIPAESSVRAQLARLRVGELVHLRGELVDGVRNDGGHFHTSLTRTDSGAGACEVMLVESVESGP